MKKYIFNLCDNVDKVVFVYSHNGWTEVDVKEISDCEPYTEPDLGLLAKENFERGYRQRKAEDEKEIAEYEKEIEETWKYAKKIAVNPVHGGYTTEEMNSIFGTPVLSDVFDLSASEAIKKIRQYEQEKEQQIQVGNEVESGLGFGIITSPLKDGAFIMWRDGSSGWHKANEYRLTGRHFPELVELLRKMKEKP